VKIGFLDALWNIPVTLWAGINGVFPFSLQQFHTQSIENTSYDIVADRSSATTRQPSCYVNKQTGVKELPALPNTINIPKQELSFLLGSDFHFVFTYTTPNSPQNSFVSCSRKSSAASSCSSRSHFKSIIDPPICM
jgi:hypothetical protein